MPGSGEELTRMERGTVFLLVASLLVAGCAAGDIGIYSYNRRLCVDRPVTIGIGGCDVSTCDATQGDVCCDDIRTTAVTLYAVEARETYLCLLTCCLLCSANA